MQKTKRLLAIEKIITAGPVSSQGDLLKKLRAKGVICTQATLSRDLRQLGAGRIPDGAGNYRYALTPQRSRSEAGAVIRNVLPVIFDIVEARSLLLIVTMPGNASATAYQIDNASRYEIAGTIAGDDTILVIPRDGITMGQVHACLELIFPGLHRKMASAIKPETRKLTNKNIT
ncbi:MAG: hypothetical protein WCE64_07545 [Bacteroidales bacterium]